MTQVTDPPLDYDLVIAGGGINGCGIARDAALRGLKVLLCESHDLAAATSSSSTKLIHGGLRYLEHREFRLVREALAERERLLRIAPHVIWPLRFILPHNPAMRPAWMVRAGLLLYDQLARRDVLPPTRTYQLANDPAGAPLLTGGLAFEYSDCWVDDARLVVLNAVAARQAGATILTRTMLEAAQPVGDHWSITLAGQHGRTVAAKVLVNACGPWASVLRGRLLEHESVARTSTRLVRGSHIIVPALFDHDRAYILQNDDRRVIFAIPYEHDYTLVGTTDIDHEGDPREAAISPAETDYLLAAANRVFRRQTTPDDVTWSYAGVRGLFDDGATDAQEVTRDYVIKVDRQPAPLVNILGGKLTTYRKLAEATVNACAPWCAPTKPCTTGSEPLPGGDFPVDGFTALVTATLASCPDMPEATARRLVRAYGTATKDILGGAAKFADLGEDFGGGLTTAEVKHLVDNEWAMNAEDVLWRRSKLGLHLTNEQAARLAQRLTKP